MAEITPDAYDGYNDEQIRTKIRYFNERIALLESQIEDQEWMRDELLGIIALRGTAV